MKAAILFLVGLAILFECQGQSQTIVTVTAKAYFSDLVGGKNMTVCRPAEDLIYGGPAQVTCGSLTLSVPPPSQGRWGRPDTSLGKSGLGFTPITDKIVATDTDFFLGSLTHFNFPIYDAANGTTLNIIFLVKDAQNNVMLANYTYKFPMLIDETPNTPPCPYPGNTNCSDKISFRNTLNLNQSFTLGAVDYTLRLIGFKESNSSSSISVDYFISNEKQSSVAYLFARITAACPRSCVNGGSPILYNNQECRCNCTTATCPQPKVFLPNCGCTCPNLDQCNNGNGGVLNNNTCTCNCVQCNAPLITNPNDCSCSCPVGYCNNGFVSNPQTCGCTCPSSACPIQNEVRDNRCNCQCNITCPTKYKEDPNPNVCGCICANSTCNPGYSIDNNCNCQCTRTCPNGQILDRNACQCTDCVGNWQKNITTGLCTVCNLTCSNTETLDTNGCACICTNLVCDLFNLGLVIDTSKPCACRPCNVTSQGTRECFCGNGKIEIGEQCDTGNVTDPCCKNCTYTRAPCDDLNGCTDGDTCNGNGTCKGDYKCPPSSECNLITCDTNVGICQNTWVLNGTTCGGSTNLCNQRCAGGVCNMDPVICPADNNTIDCMAPVCQNGTGTCSYQPTSGNGCTDGNSCTINDICTNGVCTGTAVVCPPSNDPCKISMCVDGSCTFELLSGISCNADNSSCTPNDLCVRGICLPGERIVCNSTSPCQTALCDPSSGLCVSRNIPDAENKTCDDLNVCTIGDACVNGTCKGTFNPALIDIPPCGTAPPSSAVNNTIIIVSVAGAAALIAAIAGLAFLIKKIRASKLLDPDTWNPDAFSSVGANPLYKGSEKIVDNRLYEL